MTPTWLQYIRVRELPVFHKSEWWDRPRWWLVKVLGGTNPNDTVTVTRIPIDGKTFAERIFSQRRDLTDQFRREAMTIWMGAEDYQALMSSPEILQQFRMSSSFNWGEHEVYGLTVEVIPWMRGALVMPDGFRFSRVDRTGVSK